MPPGNRRPRSASAMRSLIRSARVWMVNGTLRIGACTARGEFAHPVDAEAEDVVGEPDVVRGEGALQMRHLRGDVAAARAADTDCPRSAWRTRCSETSSRARPPCSG